MSRERKLDATSTIRPLSNQKVGKARCAGVVGVLCLTFGFHIASQERQASLQGITVDIPAQPLREALRVFADQTHLQVVYRTEQIDPSALSTRVNGTYRAEEALRLLLGATNLRALRINAKTLAIRPISDKTRGGDSVIRASSQITTR